MASNSQSNVANFALATSSNQFFPGTLCNDLVIIQANPASQLVLGTSNGANGVIVGPNKTTLTYTHSLVSTTSNMYALSASASNMYTSNITAQTAAFSNLNVPSIITANISGSANNTSNLVSTPSITVSNISSTGFSNVGSFSNSGQIFASNVTATTSISASNINATTFTGALTGTATGLAGNPNINVNVITASNVSAATFIGNLTGNALSASNLVSSPNISVANVTSTGNFTNIGTFNNSSTIIANSLTATGTVTAPIFAGVASSSLATTTCTGNAQTASNLVNSPNITVANISSSSRSNTGTFSNSSTIIAASIGINKTPIQALDIIGNINLTGDLYQNGTLFTSASTNSSSSTITFQSLGSSSNPISGGVITLDTTLSLSAIVELSSNAGALSLNLNPSNFNTNEVGNTGNIVIVERNPAGRSITLDPRIQFPTYANGIATAFGNTGFYSSTCSNFTTSAPPAAGGFAVDAISYYIPKLGFAIGTYNRMFKCMPPTFNTIPAQTGTTAIAAYALDVASYLTTTYASYYGPLAFSMTGLSGQSIPASMSISQNGIISINQNTSYAGTVTINVLGTTGLTTKNIAFTIQAWATPVITNTITVPANTDTAVAAYVVTAPILSQTSTYTGILTWSVNPSTLSSYLDVATGVLTIPKNTAISSTTVTLTATGPTGLSTNTSFNLTVLPWQDPTFSTAIPDTSTNTATGPYVISAPTVSQDVAHTGTLTWSISPSNLSTYLNTTTGVLTFPIHTTIPTTTATLTATGPSGENQSDVFVITVIAWIDPVLTTITPAPIYYTGPSAVTITPVQTLANTGTLTWTMAPANVSSYINSSTGVITIPQNTAFTATTVTVTATGPSGEYDSTSFSLTTTLWNTPVVTAIATQSGSTASTSFTVTPTQTATSTGTIVWSLSPVNSYINSSTGLITVPMGTSIAAVTYTVTATGPTGLTNSKTFSLTTMAYTTPVVTAIATQSGSTISTSFTVTPGQTATGTGTIVWSLSPVNSYINSSTGLITVPMGTSIAAVTYTVTATGPTGLANSQVFYLTTFSKLSKLMIGSVANHSLIITPLGQIHAFGLNANGQLGNNTLTNSKIPINVSSFGSLSGKTIVSIAAGDSHTLALDTSGQIHAFGNNAFGQLGNNTLTNSKIPINISSFGSLSGKTIIAIAAGAYHTFALDTSGQIHAFGYNNNGQLGNNTGTDSQIPINISSFGSLSGKTIISIAAGTYHTLALDTSGQIHVFGKNGQGQLGYNTPTYSLIPINISSFGSLSGKTIISIVAGGDHTLALDTSGQIHAFGNNFNGQLGNNTTTNSKIPINISSFGSLSGKTIISIAAGAAHTLALDTSGQIHAFGDSSQGQLGNNTLTQSYIPINISSFGSLSGKTIISIAAGYSHTLALDTSGQIHAFGNNGEGELGNNTLSRSQIPITVTGFGSLSSLSVTAPA